MSYINVFRCLQSSECTKEITC